MGDKKKKATMFIRLVSAAGTGFFYVKRKPTKITEKLEFRKYDPRVNRHVLFTEAKMKWKKRGIKINYPFNLDLFFFWSIGFGALQLVFFLLHFRLMSYLLVFSHDSSSAFVEQYFCTSTSMATNCLPLDFLWSNVLR